MKHVTDAPGPGARVAAPPAGRDTSVGYRRFCAVLTLLAAAAGLIAIAGSHFSDKVFAWETASPVNLLLLGALFVGAVPLMAAGALEMTWENGRIAVIPGAVLVTGLALGTLRDLGDTFLSGGGLIALGFSAVWLAALVGTTVWALVGIPGQLAEPSAPMARQHPLPTWTVPLIALQGAGWFGLGFAFILRPELGEQWIPWEVAPLDVGAIGAVCLTLGVALLQALTENDLARVRAGLYTLLAVGVLGLVALGVSHGEIEWGAWTGPIPALLLLALTVTGAVGIAINMADRKAPPDA